MRGWAAGPCHGVYSWVWVKRVQRRSEGSERSVKLEGLRENDVSSFGENVSMVFVIL